MRWSEGTSGLAKGMVKNGGDDVRLSEMCRYLEGSSEVAKQDGVLDGPRIRKGGELDSQVSWG